MSLNSNTRSSSDSVPDGYTASASAWLAFANSRSAPAALDDEWGPDERPILADVPEIDWQLDDVVTLTGNLPVTLPYGGPIAAAPVIRGTARKAYLPSPDDIRAACLEFQAGWSEDERLLRERGLTYDGKASGRKAVR